MWNTCKLAGVSFKHVRSHLKSQARRIKLVLHHIAVNCIVRPPPPPSPSPALSSVSFPFKKFDSLIEDRGRGDLFGSFVFRDTSCGLRSSLVCPIALVVCKKRYLVSAERNIATMLKSALNQSEKQTMAEKYNVCQTCETCN